MNGIWKPFDSYLKKWVDYTVQFLYLRFALTRNRNNEILNIFKYIKYIKHNFDVLLK